MSKFLHIPVKAIPMELDSSFTPVEMIGKLSFKINEIIQGFNDLNKKIDDLDLDNIDERIDNLETELNTDIQELNDKIEQLKPYIDNECARILLEANQYTDRRILEILNYKTITASDFDNLGITAQVYDDMNITAYRYDTESASIFIIN